MIPPPEVCFAAVEGRDPRFDGWFVLGVSSTGIYCRPSCPARTPRRANARFFPTAAAAQSAGFRSCKRCRPDATPGSPEWDSRADVVARAVRLIDEGTVEREGVAGLAAHLGYGSRQLQRLLHAELGAGALALARARRAETARLLCETTDLPMSEVALTAGFGSIRQFNDTVRAIYATTPGALRADARSAPRSRRAVSAHPPGLGDTPAPMTLELRLTHRRPFAAEALLAFLTDRTVVGVEEMVVDGEGRPTGYRRSLALPHGPATVLLTPDDGHVRATLALGDGRDLGAAVARSRRILDLDADPVTVDAHLARDPLLAPLVRARPGLRVPGCGDGFEALVRAVVGQQVSGAGARTTLGRLAQRLGAPLPPGHGRLTHAFPSPEAVAALDPISLAMPRRRAAALVAAAEAVARGGVELGPGADRTQTRNQLLAVPGIGPWTVQYLEMRGLRDPDAFLPSDLGVARRLAELDPTAPTGPDALSLRAERWRPWRAYATIHLWSTPA